MKQPRPTAEGPAARATAISAAALTAASHLSGTDYTFEPRLRAQQPALSGSLRRTQLRDGLNLHVSDTVDLHDLRTSTLLRPGFTVYLFLLDGPGLDAQVGRRPLPVGRHRCSPDPVLGIAMFRARPTSFVRTATAGTRIRKVSVTAGPDWLAGTFGEAGPPMPDAAREHLAISRWLPSYGLCEAVAHLFEADEAGTALRRLQEESLALTIMGEALATLQPPGSAAATRLERLQLSRAQELIEARLTEPLQVSDVAGGIGIGEASLQRLFRFHHGTSVMDYCRGRRLDRARATLEGGASVETASQEAGYKSPANFSTAFRRRFGISPRQARAGR